MRNKEWDNWYSTKELSENLCNVLGMSRLVTMGFTRIISEALVHRVAEQALDSDTRVHDVKIEIPYIGLLTLKLDSNDIIESSIELEDEFRDQIMKAVISGESPLVKHTEDSLVDRIKKQYKSLL